MRRRPPGSSPAGSSGGTADELAKLAQLRDQGVALIANVGGIADVELDPTDVGLVRDVLRVDLHRYREPHRHRQHQSFLSGASDAVAYRWDVERLEQGDRFGFGENVAFLVEGAFDDEASRFYVRFFVLEG